MHDGSIPVNKLIAYTLWGLASILLLAAWGTWLGGEAGLPLMLGFTSCGVFAVAAVAHVRCYAAAICRLVRVVGDLERPPAPLRPLP